MSKSSHKWLKEHNNDHYVKLAQAEGWRSRAVYKLMEVDEKDRMFKPGLSVLELGAAPGGWTEYIAKALKIGQSQGKHSVLVATDILAMDAIEGVDIIQGDFKEDAVFDQLMGKVPEGGFDWVLSDMAANLSGNKSVDQPRNMYLVELSIDMATKALKPGGSLFFKVFHGEGFDQTIAECKRLFDKVIIRKPKASRGRSQETYCLAKGLKS